MQILCDVDIEEFEQRAWQNGYDQGRKEGYEKGAEDGHDAAWEEIEMEEEENREK